MNPKNYKQIAMGGLIGVLSIWFVLDRFAPSAQPATASAATEVAVDVEEDADLDAPLIEPVDPALEEAREVWTNKAWPANPFKHDRAQSAKSNTEDEQVEGTVRYSLSAIVNGKRPLALIEGAYLSVGDRLPDGSRIQAIHQNSVTLEGPDGPWKLTLPE